MAGTPSTGPGGSKPCPGTLPGIQGSHSCSGHPHSSREGFFFPLDLFKRTLCLFKVLLLLHFNRITFVALVAVGEKPGRNLSGEWMMQNVFNLSPTCVQMCSCLHEIKVKKHLLILKLQISFFQLFLYLRLQFLFLFFFGHFVFTSNLCMRICYLLFYSCVRMKVNISLL